MGRGQRAYAGRGATGAHRRSAALERVADGLRLHGIDDLAGAEAAYRNAIRLAPRDPAAHHLLGLCLRRTSRDAEAVAVLTQAAALSPRDPDILADLGLALRASGDREGARDAFQRALGIRGDHPKAWGGLTDLGGIGAEAVASLRRLVAAQPAHADGYLSLAGVLAALRDTDAARDILRSGLDAAAISEQILENHAADALTAGRAFEALAAYELLAERRPQDPRAQNVYGCALFSQGRLEQAHAAFQRALAADPKDGLAHINLGAIFTEFRRTNEALDHYRRAVAACPNAIIGLYGLVDQQRHACEWGDLRENELRMLAMLGACDVRVAPFKLLVSELATPSLILRTARIWAAGVSPPADRLEPAALPPSVPGRRIRVGYLSNDFFEHAVSMLAIGLFEHHDRTRFEVFAYSHARNDSSDLRVRLETAFEHFVEIGDIGDAEAARRIRADEIDILVDLKGYTFRARTEIFALRPAPVQVNYLGYPGTMGAPFIDYLLGDCVITPEAHQPDYSEQLVRLPDCYQPNDNRRPIAPERPSRAACGLPDDAFVFCCFNNNSKITPTIFAIWMRILARVPGSVLWLYEANPAAQDNLQYAAGAQGIDPGRLVFAPNWPSALHLARIGHADLVLDTLPYNAHTTASDALWTGVPVLTCLGETMAGRVAASILHAAGLPDLVTTSLEAYEALACALATDRPRLDGVRARLAANRARAPLFDTARYARGIEAAYARMHALRCAGRPPEAFTVPREPFPDGFDPGLDPNLEPRQP
jgi:protein O-GlcNAc transferase